MLECLSLVKNAVLQVGLSKSCVDLVDLLDVDVLRNHTVFVQLVFAQVLGSIFFLVPW